jgi:hypothetical protein
MRAFAALLVLAWIGLNGWWLTLDTMPRDGDEEGHVGAAELFMVDLREQRWEDAGKRLFIDDMGDYPSLYPALTGAWWAATGAGDPGRPEVRAINLLWLAIAGAAVAGIAWRAGAEAGPAWLGGASVLWLPLNTGLARHFMPEGMLVATVALAVLAAAWQRESPGWLRSGLLGLAIGFGLLTKQTFVLYAVFPVLALVRWRASLVAVPLVATAIAGPWLFNNALEQAAYVEASAGYPGGMIKHVLFYLWALTSPGLGVVWLVALAVGFIAATRGDMGRLAGFAGLWLVGTLLLLILVPKKYERLLAPMLPAVGLIVAAVAQRGPWEAVGGVMAGAAWTVAASTTDLAQPSNFSQDFHPGCTQVWLRPPVTDDWGLSALADASRNSSPGPILMRGEMPEIPCSVQTTHPWDSHVSPYLRRVGQERELATEGGGAIVIDWGPANEGDLVVPLPSLGAELTILALTAVGPEGE